MGVLLLHMSEKSAGLHCARCPFLDLAVASLFPLRTQIQGGAGEGLPCKYTQHSLFLYCCLLVTVLFSIQTVNLLSSLPAFHHTELPGAPYFVSAHLVQM